MMPSPFRHVTNVIQFIGSGTILPDPSTYAPLMGLLNAEDIGEKDHLTREWRDHKLQELNFVGVVAALIAGVLTSTGSWPTILPNGMSSPWPIRTSWYCGIILAMTSILSAADQTIRLHRLSSHPDSLHHIRHVLSSRHRSSDGKYHPRRGQVLTWQMPVMFLSASVICMIVGMFATVWAATANTDINRAAGWWNENRKVAVTFTTLACVSGLIFFAGQISLYSPVQELGKDQEGGESG